MCSIQEDAKSRFKLAQLWKIADFFNGGKSSSKISAFKRIVNEILTDDININCKVTIRPKKYPPTNKVHLNNCTVLHFVCCGSFDVDIFTNLLERGADFTMKNENGQTALHMMTTMSFQGNIAEREVSFIDSVLSAHVEHQNFINPRDEHGISHLHGACVANHVGAVKLFLDNGASVDEVVNIDAPPFSGYTPLHFAARFHSFDVADILVSRGANVNVKDEKGMTPLDLCVESRLLKLNDVRFQSENCSSNERIIKLLLEKHCLPTIGLTPFHIACTLRDLSIAKKLLTQFRDVGRAITTKASFGTNYAALHFAALNSIEAVKMLLTHGAKFEIEDANGVTPFDICIENYTIEEIHDALRCTETWNHIYLSDGETKLLDFVGATRSLEQFRLFLKSNGKDSIVPVNSSLWPGCTILHLAVIFSTYKLVGQDRSWGITYDGTIVSECLKEGLDVNAQNTQGQTPVHLAFKSLKESIVKLLLERIIQLDEVTNIVDEDNLSYLHIACVMRNETLVERILGTSEPNVAYKGNRTLWNHVVSGSTPLHLAITMHADAAVELLLRHDANLHATDVKGTTPIHWLLKVNQISDHQRITDALFDSLLENPKDVVVDEVGLTYLHVASCFGRVDVIEALLNRGSNVNAIFDQEKLDWPRSYLSFCSRYLSPLNMATKFYPVEQVLKTLIRHGADVFAEESQLVDGCVKPSCAPIILSHEDVTRCFLSVLWERDDMQKMIEQRLGLTKLHIACHMKNEEALRSALTDELDVNAQVRADSVVFAGCTPLHLLMTVSVSRYGDQRNSNFTVGSMLQMLLDRGADVTISNAQNDTPLHVHLRHERMREGDRCKTLLIEAHRDFSVNPMNAQGWTHFHLACRWHKVEVVEQFLQQGSVDVDRPIDYFARHDAGCTALHLALNSPMFPNGNWEKLSLTVDLLLNHGANVAAKDVYGDTPLLKRNVLGSPEMRIVDKLVSSGVDVTSKNVKGQTIFDKYRISNQIGYAETLEKHNYQINSWNSLTGEGNIAKVFVSQLNNLEDSTQFKKSVQSPDAKTVDELGRTAIHNSVAFLSSDTPFLKNHVFAIKTFIEQGIDIDHQDESGLTAMHYAAKMGNESGVVALLELGADINIVDSRGKSALSYCNMNYAEEVLKTNASVAMYITRDIIAIFNLYIKKLQHLKLEVSQLNRNLVSVLEQLIDECETDHFPSDEDFEHIPQSFFNQVEIAKTTSIGTTSLTLFDLLKETGLVTTYACMPVSEQSKIDTFLNSNTFDEFDELVGVIKLQCRKIKSRLGLIEPAMTSLRILLGFSIPGLCEEIAMFLTNYDLKNVIASTTSETLEVKYIRNEVL